MKRTLIALTGSLLLGLFAVAYAELPPPTSEEKAAAAASAQKAAAEKEKAAKEVAQAQDKAVANYKKNKGASSSAGATAAPKPEENSASAPAPSESQGADHAKSKRPDTDLTPQEAQTEMPKPGQANDHSTTARDSQNSSGR
jgi:hypothetical protein